MLGDLLGVGQQFGLQCAVFGFAGAAPTRAGDRAHRHLLVFDAHQDFGAGPDDVMIVQIQAIQIRRRIDPPQRSVQRHRIGVEVGRQPLRRHHLHDITGRDVLLDLGDRLAIALRRESGFEALGRHATGSARGRSWQRLRQQCLDVVEPAPRPRLIVRIADRGVHHDRQSGAQ